MNGPPHPRSPVKREIRSGDPNLGIGRRSLRMRAESIRAPFGETSDFWKQSNHQMMNLFKTTKCLHSGNSGFTFIELIAGLAVAAVLFLAVFQFLGRTTSLSVQVGESANNRQQRLVLSRLLWEDLNHQPVGNPRFRGKEKQLTRTTARLESERTLMLDTRVRYEVKETKEGQTLQRSWKWPDLQDDFGSPETILKADTIQFTYQDANGRWVKKATRAGTLTALKLSWTKNTLTIPFHHNPEDPQHTDLSR